MSQNVTLLPMAAEAPDYILSSPCALDVLALEHDSYLLDAIKEIQVRYGQPVPFGFSSHMAENSEGEHTYGAHTRDAYGHISWVPASALRGAWRASMWNEKNWRNAAIFAYLEKCPDALKVALYWH